MMSSAPSSPRAWVLNTVIKRTTFVLLVILLVKLVIMGISPRILRPVVIFSTGKVTAQPNFKEVRSKKKESGHTIANPEAHNDSALEASHNFSDAQVAELIAKDQTALRNKGVYLPLPDEIRSKIWQQNENRKQRVSDVCTRRRFSESLRSIKRYTNVAVDDENKLLYCYIPKVGCTSWKVKLALMAERTRRNRSTLVLNTHPSPIDTRRGLARFGIRMLSSYSLPGIKHRIETYYKFIFVRHPMERLVSAYRSKFEKRADNKAEHKTYYQMYGPRIRRYTRGNETAGPEDLTFEEFVRFIVHMSKGVTITDEHWEQYHKLCHLCLVEYDFIGKFDSGLVNDISYVLRKISKKPEDYWFPNVTTPRSASKHLKRYFGQVPSSQIDDLEKGYSLDFALFGFDKGLNAKIKS